MLFPSLFFPFFSNSSWNFFLYYLFRVQNLLIPGSSRIQVFLKSASPYSTAHGCCCAFVEWGRLGMEKGSDGDRMPSTAGEPRCPHVWISGDNPHLCRYNWSHPHGSKAWRLTTTEIWCPRIRDALITALHTIVPNAMHFLVISTPRHLLGLVITQNNSRLTNPVAW